MLNKFQNNNDYEKIIDISKQDSDFNKKLNGFELYINRTKSTVENMEKYVNLIPLVNISEE